MSFVLFVIVWIQSAFAGAVLVPMAPIVADGDTVSTVRLYVTDGARPRIKAESGKVGPIALGSDGIAAFPFTPVAASVPGTVNLTVTVGSEEITLPVAVVPPFSGSLSVTVEPALVPSTQTATVKIVPKGTSPVAANQRRLTVKASVGTIEALTPMGDGTWAARYTPPKGLTAPALVAISAVDAAAPGIWGVTALPVTLKRSVTFDAPANSQNVFDIGGRSYGPAVASPAGKVAVDIDLDPRITKGTQRIVNADTSKQTKEVDIPGAATPQLVVLPAPASLPADAAVKATLRVVQIAADGTVSAPSGITASASRGTVTVGAAKGGAVELSFTPPTTLGDVTITATLNGASASTTLRIGSALPTISLSADPPQIAKAGSSVKVVARVKDAQGTSVSGALPTMSAEGATVSGAKDNKDGSYAGSVSVSSKTNRIRLYATPAVTGSTNGAVQLLAWPSSPTVNANGSDQVVVTVVAVDAWDMPVPNVSFRVGVPKLDGTAPATVKSDASGVARVVFTAGSTAGMSGVRIEGEGLTVETPVFQTKQGVMAAPPPGGSPAWESALARWQQAAPSLVVDREGTVAPSGPPAAVQIGSVPGYTTPGAAILVQVRVVDANGFGVGGQKLEVSASPATVGAITDNKDGNYNLPVQLPAGVDGPLTVTVKAGAASGSIQLPTFAAAGNSKAVAPLGGGSTASGGTAKINKPATISGPSRFRAGAALSNQHGSFSQTSDGGSSLAETGGYGTAVGGFWGLDLNAEWWAVDASWGGLALDVRAQGQLELFGIGTETKARLQPNVIGGLRYRRPVNNTMFWQVALGAHYTTAPVFRYPDETKVSVEMLDIPLIGARVGGLLSWEMERLYPSIEIAETFAPAPVVTHVGANVDYRLSGPLALRVGGAFDLRTSTVQAESGGAANLLGWYFTVDAGAAVHF